MNRVTPFDVLLVHIWETALSSLKTRLRTEEAPTLLSAWMLEALLSVGFSSGEPEIRDPLAQLDHWVEQIGSESGVLDESSTGLLGLWLYLCRKRQKRIGRNWEDIFLRSVEHNLQKQKLLSMSKSVGLLNAVSAGLSCIPSQRSSHLRLTVSRHLQSLSQDANALELAQMIQSWELLQRTDDIPRLEIQHRLESIVEGESETIAREKVLAQYALMRLAEVFGEAKLAQEMRLVESLQLIAATQETQANSAARMNAFLLPWLKQKMSSESLFDSWTRYTDSAFKRAKVENYIVRYLAVLGSLTFGLYLLFWSKFTQLQISDQLSIVSALVLIWTNIGLYTAQKVLELHGRPFWEKPSVKLAVGILNAALGLLTALGLILNV